ncbi:MAG: 50S ribosomal protein L11 methyltransferase [Vicingaceae bacterium]
MDYIKISFTLKPLELGRELIYFYLNDLPFDSFENTEEGVNAYIPKKEFDIEAFKNINFPSSEFEINYKIEEIKDKNWNEEWEKSYAPIIISNECIIKSPFHSIKQNYTYEVLINPQMSFGTGHHETTYLMCKKIISLDIKGKTVLDMGCGTGVLAILSSLKGADKVIAIDNDEWAYNNSKENIDLNNTTNIEVLLGGKELLTDLSTQFDLIIANINRNILLDQLEAYSNLLNKNSTILLSGFFETDIPVLANAANKFGLNLVNKELKNSWALIQLNN